MAALTEFDLTTTNRTYQHIHEGEFIAKFPLIPGHETVGVVVALGKVKALTIHSNLGEEANTQVTRMSRALRSGIKLLLTTVSFALSASTVDVVSLCSVRMYNGQSK